MNSAQHVAKAKRFQATVAKLDARDDFEMINWARMHICTHLLNGALHAAGVTPEDFDISHTWYFEDYPDQAGLDAKLGTEFREALSALTVFESLRQTHVRGPGPYGPEITQWAEDAYQRIVKFCETVLGPKSAC
jgi:hypothetical protein